MMQKIVLVLLFVVSVFGSDDELGIPYMERGEGKPDSVVTAFTSKSLFSLMNGVVTKWQISPPEKIDSFTVDTEKNKRYTIYITPDDKTLLLHSKDDISIWDIKTESLIKRVDVKSIDYHKSNVKAAVGMVDGCVFYSLGEDFRLKKWNMHTLKLIETHNMKAIHFSRSTWEEEGNCLTSEKPIYLLSSKKTILYFTANIIYVLDKKTYEVIRKTYTQWINGDFTPISIDSSCLYYVKLEMINHFQTESYIKYDIEHDRETVIKDDEKFYKKTNILRQYRRQNDLKHIDIVYARTKPTLVSRRDIRYNLYKINSGKYIASFYIYDNDVMVLVKNDGSFESSKNAKTYLKMKLSSGEVVSMNEETYKKFNQTLNLKD